MNPTKHHIALILLCCGMFYPGCKPKIMIENLETDVPIYLYGKNAARDFSVDAKISDSLKFIWRTELSGGFHNTGITVKGNYGFINDLSGRVYCINLDNGEIAGQVKIKGSVQSTPVIYKNFLVFIETSLENDSSFLSVYDILKGEYAVHKEFSGKVNSEIILNEDGIYFVTIEGFAYKFKMDGSLVWRHESKQFIHSNPALSSGVLMFGTDSGCIMGLDVNTGERKYVSKVSAKSFESGAAAGKDTAYICGNDGLFYAFDIGTGKVKFKTDIKSRSTAFPVIADNIYLVTLKGEILCLSKSGVIKWHINTGGLLNAVPLLAGGKLIIPDMSRKVLFVNSDDGKIIKAITLEGKTCLTPVVYKNFLIIGYDRGVLEGYEFIR